jgi:uncharacterized protein (DUF1810 family)
LDKYDLDRFVQAQNGVYDQALAEIRSGRKQTHWMWFVFPQLAGLGSSPMARTYAMQNLDEAREYLKHPLLGARLRECAEAVVSVSGKSAHEIFGSPDDLKLRSCATLFARVSPENSVFHRIIRQYYRGEPDEKTIRLLSLR